MKQKLILLMLIFIFCSCLSYENLQEMKLEKNKLQSKENLTELIEILEDPCDDPHFYAHVMETAAYLRKDLVLSLGLKERYENAFDKILTSFDLSESMDWEVEDIDQELEYIHSLALQMLLNRKESSESVAAVKRYLKLRHNFSKRQILIYSKAVKRNEVELKKDYNFCNLYLNKIFITKHYFNADEKKFFAAQMDYFLNPQSAFLFSGFLKIYKPDSNCLNSLMEYAYIKGFNFGADYKIENFLRDLASFKLEGAYQQKLRNNLYLKYLNYSKMNSLIEQSYNPDILTLNEQLLIYSINKDFKWDKNAFHKNVDLLFEMSRVQNELGLKTKEMLIRVAPGLYGLALIQKEQDSNSFKDLLSIYKLMQSHTSMYNMQKHFYEFKGFKYINPYFTFPEINDAEEAVKYYISKMTEIYALNLLRSNFSPDKMRPLTLSLQAYKLAQIDIFEGQYKNTDTVLKMLGKGGKDFYQKFIPYLLNLSESSTLAILVEHLDKGNYEKYQLNLFVSLFVKTSEVNRGLLKVKFSEILQKRVNDDSDQLSLEAIKIVYRLKLLDENFKKVINTRWPALKALRDDF